MFWFLFWKIDQSKKQKGYDEEVRKYNEEYSKYLDESINKNQDWLYAIMTAISLWALEKSTDFFKDTVVEKYTILIMSLFLISILFIIFNFYLDIRARTMLMLADDKEKAYGEYICKFKFIGALFNFAFWIFFASILLTFTLYVYTKL